MKIRCPRCEKMLSIPDKYAGKTIRCPGCNQAFKVPALTAALGAGGAPKLDLEDLARLEQGGSQLTEEELAAHATQEQAGIDAEAEAKLGYRTCPHCRAKIKAKDPYVELLCSHCWKPIPAVGGSGSGLGGKKIKQTGVEVTATGKGGFYTELASAFTYPIPALSSILTASGIAFLAAMLPVVVITGASSLMEQSNVGTEQGVQKADLSNVAIILMGIFGAEVFFFSAIAIHSFFDVVRTTGVRDDQPPKLTFSPSQWGKSFMSYLVLTVYYVAMTSLVIVLTMEGSFDSVINAIGTDQPLKPFEEAATPFVVGMVLISFFIPMNLIGISLGHIGQALNPSAVLKSVARTHVHYVFLVLIVCVYGGLLSYIYASMLFGWFLPQISKMRAGSTEGSLMDVALPLLAWGAVMAVFFYGTYVLGRLHGLFVRTYRKNLLFGTD